MWRKWEIGPAYRDPHREDFRQFVTLQNTNHFFASLFNVSVSSTTLLRTTGSVPSWCSKLAGAWFGMVRRSSALTDKVEVFPFFPPLTSARCLSLPLPFQCPEDRALWMKHRNSCHASEIPETKKRSLKITQRCWFIIMRRTHYVMLLFLTVD